MLRRVENPRRDIMSNADLLCQVLHMHVDKEMDSAVAEEVDRLIQFMRGAQATDAQGWANGRFEGVVITVARLSRRRHEGALQQCRPANGPRRHRGVPHRFGESNGEAMARIPMGEA